MDPPLMAERFSLGEQPAPAFRFQTTSPLSHDKDQTFSLHPLPWGKHALPSIQLKITVFMGYQKSVISVERIRFSRCHFGNFSVGRGWSGDSLKLKLMVGIYYLSCPSLLEERRETQWITIIITITKGHYVTWEGSVLQVDITMLNVQASNNRASKSMKQKQTKLKGEI